MSQIAQATFSHADFTLVMNTLWERINDHGKNWRHIYKALLVVEYLLRCGSERVISECRTKMIEIKTLMEFQKIDDHDKDVGYSIRERAKHVIEMLHDEKRLQEEREKATKNRDKYGVAMSNIAGGSGPSYSSTSNSSSYSNNSTSSSYGGTTRKPMTSMGYTPGQGTYGSAMRENRDRDNNYSSGNSLEPRGSFRNSSQSNTRSTSTRESTRDQTSRTSTQPTTRARAPSISDEEYSISDDEPPRPSTSQPRRPSNSTPNTNSAQSVDDFFAPRGGSFVSAPSTTQNTAVNNNADPLWAILAGPTAPMTNTAPTPLTTPSMGYTPFSFPPAPTSSVTTPSNNSAMLFPNTTPSVASTSHSFQALSLSSVGTGNTANNGSFFPSPRNNEDDWNDFAKAGMSSSTPSNNSLSNQLGVKSDLIDLDSLTNNKRPDTKAGTAPAYRPIVASSTTPSTGMTMTPNNTGMMMNNTGGMMGYNTMGAPNMMMNSGTAGTPNMMLNSGMNYNGGMMMHNNGSMMGNNTGGMMTPNNNGMMMNNNAMMYNNTMMTPNNNAGGMMMMNNYPSMNAGMAVNNSANNNSFKF
jgi:hypothetical protein